MLSLTLLLVAVDVLWHIFLTIIHLWSRRVPEHLRDRLIGCCYGGITVTLIAGAAYLGHH